MLSLQIRPVAGEVVLVVAQGTLLLGPDTSKFRSYMDGLRAQYREIQLDLSGITKMDAAGVGCLIDQYAKCDVQGAKLKLYDVSHTVLEILHLVKLLTVFGPCLAYETAHAA